MMFCGAILFENHVLWCKTPPVRFLKSFKNVRAPSYAFFSMAVVNNPPCQIAPIPALGFHCILDVKSPRPDQFFCFSGRHRGG